jgi:hypothetical protein
MVSSLWVSRAETPVVVRSPAAVPVIECDETPGAQAVELAGVVRNLMTGKLATEFDLQNIVTVARSWAPGGSQRGQA